MPDLTVERWLSVPGYPMYEVSDLGAVRSWFRWKASAPRTLCPSVNSRGYPSVCLSNSDVRSKRFMVHRLVLMTFVGPCPPGQEVRHLDGDKLNNALSNLRYGTSSENSLDSVAHGRHRMASRDACANGHPFTPDNVRMDGRRGRRCRECIKADVSRKATCVICGWVGFRTNLLRHTRRNHEGVSA